MMYLQQVVCSLFLVFGLCRGFEFNATKSKCETCKNQTIANITCPVNTTCHPDNSDLEWRCKAVSWMELTYNRRWHPLLVGEWILIDCTVNTSDNATLLLEGTNVHVDNKKIKMTSINIFNITNLTRNDRGQYTCKVCKKSRKVTKLKVTRAGKAFLKPVVIKTPNKTQYDLRDKVELRCRVDNSSGNIGLNDYSNYGHVWYKLRSTGSWEKLKDNEKQDLENTQKDRVVHGRVLLFNRLLKEDNGIYKCEMSRSVVNHYAFALVNITFKERSKPKIYNIMTDQQIFTINENENFELSYEVKSYPVSDIDWSSLKDGENDTLITKCLAAEKKCNKHGGGREIITRKSFKLEDAEFPRDTLLTYTLKANNTEGNDTKSFKIDVYVKPEIQHEEFNDVIFKKGMVSMVINCPLKNKKRVNPPKVNYTWYQCDVENCTKAWKLLDSKSNSSLKIPKPQKEKTKYRCTIRNVAGSDESEMTAKVEIDLKQTERIQTEKSLKTLLFSIIPIGLITMIILVVAGFVLYKRKKIYGGFYLFSYPPLPDYMESLEINGDIEEQLQKLPYISEWEFPRERISFVSELGFGEFGVVWLAEAVGITAFHPRDVLRERENRRRFSFFHRMSKRNSYVYCKEVTKVAVKRTKESWDRNKLVDLQSELKILIHVGENENIVNILGACTKGKSSNLWIIMEYCPNGNLRQFLRSIRDIYSVDEESLKSNLPQNFGPNDLIYLAWQIAKGMTFLISRKIIHRDLAARNVLLGYGYKAKVGDFGLARDVYKYNAYLKNSSGLLPFKWMAIESLRDSIYTEKTDMWSFGILLWELFTLGGTPYPGMHANDVYQMLLNGKRMEPPMHCPQEICDIMSKCWNENPEDRQNFQDLKQTVYEILGHEEIAQVSARLAEREYCC